MRTAALTLRNRSESAAAGLPALLVAAERVAQAVAPGVHGRRRAGVGEAFWQYRPYTPGDAVSRIDWRQTAKSDQVYLREQEWEAAQSLWIWRDASSSMQWRSIPGLPTKKARAEVIVLALALLLLRGGERVGLIEGAQSGHPVTNTQGAQQIARALVAEAEDGPALPLEACRRLARFAGAVLVSDWLHPLEEVEALLSAVAERSLSGTLVAIIDPAEARLPYSGRVRFQGTEGEGAWLLSRTEDVRADYRRRFAAHHAALDALAGRYGWRVLRHRSDRPAEAALLALVQALDTPYRMPG